MPGPSQAGKFKPRKPAKKIRAGAAAAAAVVPDAAPSSSTSSATAAAVAAAAPGREGSRGRRDGREGRGRGRDGRGRGRGRGRRAPLPQGQVFFTAATSASDRRASTSRSKSKSGDKDEKTGLVRKKKDEASEEVVGQLDKAIGSALGEDGGGKRSVLEDYNDGDYQGPSKFDNEEEGGRFFNEDGIFYDSDSSVEAAKPRPRSSNIQPTRLPYPVAQLPVGIGGDKRPTMYEDQSKEADETEADAAPHQPRPSPFVDANDVKALRKEMESFFLFQFPTRLPALVQQSTSSTKKETVDDVLSNDQEMQDAEQQDAVKVEDSGPVVTRTAEVVTAPTQPGSFDNSLTGAIPGRLGKLVVYKSGKTVLLLQGPDGSPEIRMNVSEGLTCSFEQQAVMIDPDQGRFTKLGSVHKSAVVTPDLDRAFGNS